LAFNRQVIGTSRLCWAQGTVIRAAAIPAFDLVLRAGGHDET
jgi:hypothetical protein